MRKFSQQWPYACFPAAETKPRDLCLVGAKGEPGCRAKPCSSQRTLTGRMRSPVFSRWVEEVIEEAQAAGQRRSWRDAGDKTPWEGIRYVGWEAGKVSDLRGHEHRVQWRPFPRWGQDTSQEATPRLRGAESKSRACGDQRLWALVLPRGEGIQARLPLDQGATQGGPPPRWGAGSSKAGGGPGSEPASAGILGRAHSTDFTPALLLPHHSSFTVSLSTHPGKV